MNIREVEIDGFGAWQNLQLRDLEPGLSVIYGPNEAGKTTLLQFVRSVLYGFTGKRRDRYVPPAGGGQAGGALLLEDRLAQHKLTRHCQTLKLPPAIPGRSSGPASILGRDNEPQYGPDLVSLSTTDGRTEDPARLHDLLGGVDEAIFNNIFAIGLREIQELGSLNDTAAAQWLYNLTTGLDRVSLGDVLRELETARQQLLVTKRPIDDERPPEPGQITRLLNQRRRLREEQRQLDDLTEHYTSLARDRDAVQEEIARLEAESAELSGQVRTVELASSLRDKWQRRAWLDQQLAAVPNGAAITPALLEKLEKHNVELKKERKRLAQVKAARKKLRDQAKQLELNQALWRVGPRIHALADQQEWISGLEKQIRASNDELRTLEREIEEQRQRLNLEGNVPPELLKSYNVGKLTALKPLVRSLEESGRRLEAAQREQPRDDDSVETLSRQIKQGLSDADERDLIPNVERAGTLVSLLRRRTQLDPRIEQMTAHEQELDAQSRELLDRQLLPVWSVVGLGAIFVVGVALILAGWLLSFGLGTAVLGIIGIVAAVGTKYALEQSAQEELETCERQLGTLRTQLQQARHEREEIDAQIPQGGGPMLRRLEAAESELSRLETLLPLEAQRKMAVQDTVSAKRRLQDAEEEHAANERRWQAALKAAGWSAKFSPREVWQLSTRCRALRNLYRQLEKGKESQQQAVKSVESYSERLALLLAEAGLAPVGDSPSARIRQLRSELTDQENLSRTREDLVAKDRKWKRRLSKCTRAARRTSRYRRRLLERAGAADEADFRRRYQQQQQVVRWQEDRAAVQRDISATLGEEHQEETLREQLLDRPNETYEQRWDRLSSRLHACEAMLRERFEQRGKLSQQLQSLAQDRRAGDLQLELGMVEQRLRQAVERWQTLAVTTQTLENIRKLYGLERQPETLQEASDYLRRLTGGRYTRVWTPLDEDVLFVDEAGGKPQRVAVLSRGTREQLFLSLRLALVSHYSRRGVQLPLVLDDVLVNFDRPRTEAAAQLLIDFASRGRQVLLFTCHEHLAELLASLGVSVRTLPQRSDGPATELPKPKTKTSKKLVEPLPELPVLPPPPLPASLPPPIPETIVIEYEPPKIALLEAEPIEDLGMPMVPIEEAKPLVATKLREPRTTRMVLPEPEPVAEQWIEPEPLTVFIGPPEPLPKSAAAPWEPLRIELPTAPPKPEAVPAPPPPPASPLKSREIETWAQWQWDAEEFDGELTDRVFFADGSVDVRNWHKHVKRRRLRKDFEVA